MQSMSILRCPECNKKLGEVEDISGSVVLRIICPRCKKLIAIHIGGN